MSIEFSAVSLQRDVFEKYANSPKLEAVWKLGPFLPEFFEDPRGALVSVKARLEMLKAYIEDYPLLINNIEQLVQNMELPTLSLALGTDWQPLEAHFAKFSAKSPILKKAFHSGQPTPHRINCSHGPVDYIEGSELKELSAAIKAAGAPDEELEPYYEDLLEFYQDAVENDDIVLRGLD